MAAKFSSELAGQYRMASKILILPAAIIGSAVSQVFFQRASKDIHLGVSLVRTRYIKVCKMLALVGIIPLLLVGVYGEEIFSFVLGQHWIMSGKISQLLIFSAVMYFIFSPTASILIILGRQKILLIFSLLQLAYRLGLALIVNDAMDFICWLVFCEVFNVFLFELVVIYYLYLKSESKNVVI
jgi:O-antigen/teichoic acid export membrane protein